MVNFRKITEENFDAIINMKRPEGETLVVPNAVSLAQAWPYWNKKSAWKAANFPGAFLRNIHSFRQQTGKLQFDVLEPTHPLAPPLGELAAP